MKKKNVMEMQVEQRDALVVRGEQPRPHAVLLVQIVFALDGLRIGVADRGQPYSLHLTSIGCVLCLRRGATRLVLAPSAGLAAEIDLI